MRTKKNTERYFHPDKNISSPVDHNSLRIGFVPAVSHCRPLWWTAVVEAGTYRSVPPPPFIPCCRRPTGPWAWMAWMWPGCDLSTWSSHSPSRREKLQVSVLSPLAPTGSRPTMAYTGDLASVCVRVCVACVNPQPLHSFRRRANAIWESGQAWHHR